MNICQCGTQAGYQHPYACPFPYYGNAPDRVYGWQSAAADLAQATADATGDECAHRWACADTPGTFHCVECGAWSYFDRETQQKVVTR